MMEKNLNLWYDLKCFQTGSAPKNLAEAIENSF